MATAIPDGMNRLDADGKDFKTVEEYIEYMREQINFSFAQADKARRDADREISALREQIKTITDKVNEMNGGT